MPGSEFGWTMRGQGHAHVVVDGEETRLRYLVADAFSHRARERAAEGRPDKAGLLRSIATQIESGGCPSKKSMGKARSDRAIVRARLVDGVPLAGDDR